MCESRVRLKCWTGWTRTAASPQARTWHIHQDVGSLFIEARLLIDLLLELPLRPLDDLHLAYARHYDAEAFATADKNQAEAAQALGIPTFTFSEPAQ